MRHRSRAPPHSDRTLAHHPLTSTPPIPPPHSPLAVHVRLLRAIVVAATVTIPLVIQGSGRDAFRTPKALFLAGSAIVIAAFFAAAWLLGALKLKNVAWRAPETVFVVTAVLWVLLTALTSTNR